VTVTATYRNTVPPVLYNIHIGAFSGGSVTADKYVAEAGETVTLTVSPNASYELKSISATDATVYGSGNTRWFTMPTRNVTVTAVFENPTRQAAWQAALKLIEANTFTLTQQQALNEATARYRLAELINELIKATGFVISYNDIVIYTFVPANSGTTVTPLGINGKIEFRVTPPETFISAYSNGSIMASPVSNDVIVSNPLTAYVQNGILYVSGLKAGEKWNIYNILGALIYTATATGDTDSTGSLIQEIPLPARGIYIITTGNRTVKTVN